MSWLLDAHIHLSDPEYDADIDYVINSMNHLHIKACCVSMDLQTSQKTLDLAKKSNLILPFIGIHPEKAQENPEPVIHLISDNSDQISGIGEIGLDKTFTNTDQEFKIQEDVFRSQLELAEKLKKPVSIHSRKTLDEIFQIMSSYSLDSVLLHWFDGSKRQLQQAMDLNFFVSFGPVMLYAQDKQVLLAKANQDRILVETDGPVRFSKCFELHCAQISFIPSVVFCASQVLNKSYDELCKLLEKNSNRYLNL